MGFTSIKMAGVTELMPAWWCAHWLISGSTMRRWLLAAGVCALSATQATAFLPLLDGSRRAGSGVALWAGPGRNVYGSKSSGGQGGAFGRYGRDDRRRNKKAPEAEASKDPKKRVANLTKKLNSILEVSSEAPVEAT